MKKLFMSFVALCMVAVLGIGAAVPAMAVECEATDTEMEIVSMSEMEGRAGSQVGGMSGTCTIRAGSILGTCYVPARATTMEVTITGVRGIIILEFDNQDTGDHRSFTAIGGDTLSSGWVSSLDAGNWTASVLMCDNNASNCRFDIKFYR